MTTPPDDPDDLARLHDICDRDWAALQASIDRQVRAEVGRRSAGPPPSVPCDMDPFYEAMDRRVVESAERWRRAGRIVLPLAALAVVAIIGGLMWWVNSGSLAR